MIGRPCPTLRLDLVRGQWGPGTRSPLEVQGFAGAFGAASPRRSSGAFRRAVPQVSGLRLGRHRATAVPGGSGGVSPEGAPHSAHQSIPYWAEPTPGRAGSVQSPHVFVL